MDIAGPGGVTQRPTDVQETDGGNTTLTNDGVSTDGTQPTSTETVRTGGTPATETDHVSIGSKNEVVGRTIDAAEGTAQADSFLSGDTTGGSAAPIRPIANRSQLDAAAVMDPANRAGSLQQIEEVPTIVISEENVAASMAQSIAQWKIYEEMGLCQFDNVSDFVQWRDNRFGQAMKPRPSQHIGERFNLKNMSIQEAIDQAYPDIDPNQREMLIRATVISTGTTTDEFVSAGGTPIDFRGEQTLDGVAVVIPTLEQVENIFNMASKYEGENVGSLRDTASQAARTERINGEIVTEDQENQATIMAQAAAQRKIYMELGFGPFDTVFDFIEWQESQSRRRAQPTIVQQIGDQYTLRDMSIREAINEAYPNLDRDRRELLIRAAIISSGMTTDEYASAGGAPVDWDGNTKYDRLSIVIPTFQQAEAILGIAHRYETGEDEEIEELKDGVQAAINHYNLTGELPDNILKTIGTDMNAKEKTFLSSDGSSVSSDNLRRALASEGNRQAKDALRVRQETANLVGELEQAQSRRRSEQTDQQEELEHKAEKQNRRVQIDANLDQRDIEQTGERNPLGGRPYSNSK